MSVEGRVESGKFTFCWVILGEAVPISIELEICLISIFAEIELHQLDVLQDGKLKCHKTHSHMWCRPLSTSRFHVGRRQNARARFCHLLKFSSSAAWLWYETLYR